MITADFRPHPLHAPLTPWFDRGVVALADLNAAADRLNVQVGSGLPLQFVDAGAGPDMAYEARAYQYGEVETRADNWHDLFGAWVWLTFPRSKAAMNRRHWQAMQAEQGARGPVRDALTQFDECGVVVLCSDMTLWQSLCCHQWRDVFVRRRVDVLHHLRFLVFGHGSLDALRFPFIGLCGKAWCFPVEALPGDAPTLVALADSLLADFLDQCIDLAPRLWQPLPLLGIPGACSDNESPAYYDDTRQFRPARRA